VFFVLGCGIDGNFENPGRDYFHSAVRTSCVVQSRLLWSLDSLVWTCVVLYGLFLLCVVLGLLSSCLVLSCLVLSCLVLSCLVVSCRVVSCRVVSCRVWSGLVWSGLVWSGLAWSGLVFSCLDWSCNSLCLSYLHLLSSSLSHAFAFLLSLSLLLRLSLSLSLFLPRLVLHLSRFFVAADLLSP
jgi:hypothetical protein